MVKDSEVLEMARYMISENATIRQTADNFGKGKTTIHKWITERLCKLNKELYDQVKTLLASNKVESVNRARQFIRR